jgi:hypothetical protein
MAPSTPPLIEVRASPVHGRGVHALRRLPRGTCIGVYEGRRYGEAALLEVDWSRRHHGLTYLFSLSDGTTIDGGEGGNATRFLNHSCEPNCQAVEVTDARGRIDLRLVTLRSIVAGAELFPAAAVGRPVAARWPRHRPERGARAGGCMPWRRWPARRLTDGRPWHRGCHRSGC